ncbi:hypothetical protein [Nitrospira moscoviensis]|uniref:Uncharacterized protein n=1 Tax=Nitrospira moscoviensis TaxID=42253 RepID=A0A0K2GCE5_NITMO|nr:hypothetical protein [Nitrospira moscoviensis]ALA58631.1 hypothetical protein NITMOv2_2215 [Nitrospira moscoviensis]
MEWLDVLFDNAFFQLPFLEAMMYLFVVISIGAGIVGLWNRFVSIPSREAGTLEMRKAA